MDHVFRNIVGECLGCAAPLSQEHKPNCPEMAKRGLVQPLVTKAESLLTQAEKVLLARGAQYGSGERERSMDKIVNIYNAMTGKHMTVVEGWSFMVAVKLARIANESIPQEDSYVDAINYLALLGEEVLGKR